MSDERVFTLLSTSDTDLLSARASGAPWRLGNPVRLGDARSVQPRRVAQPPLGGAGAGGEQVGVAGGEQGEHDRRSLTRGPRPGSSGTAAGVSGSLGSRGTELTVAGPRRARTGFLAALP